MKRIKHLLIVLFISLFIFLIIISIFWPIFIAKEVIFPYAIHPFDIVSKFPTVWKYLKIIYLISCFFNLFLAVNSILKFILIKFPKKDKKIIKNNLQNQESNFDLLLGTDNLNNKIYISEKGLYQNILVTGTIGSRQNCFMYVSIFKSANVL